MTDSKIDVIDTIRKTLTKLEQLTGGYRRRDSQLRMVNEIRQILLSDVCKVGVCEAGTGVGKTLAYLLAVVPSALAQKKKVVISSATIALQEQMVQKDLPLFCSAFPVRLEYLLVKGRGRFVCRQKLALAVGALKANNLEEEAAVFSVQPTSEEFSVMCEMFEQMTSGAWSGDLDCWGGLRLRDEIAAPLVSDSYSCKAGFKEHRSCGYHRQRAEIDNVDIVVVNHALVAADLALGGGVLIPGTSDAIYVFDEAHQLPSIVRDSTVGYLGVDGFVSTLVSLSSQLEAKRFILPLSNGDGQDDNDKAISALVLLQNHMRLLGDWCRGSRVSFFPNGNGTYRFECGRIPKSLVEILNLIQHDTGIVRCKLDAICGKLQKACNENGDDVSIVEKAISDVGFYLDRLDGVLSCVGTLLVARDGMPPAKWLDYDASKSRFSFGASEIRIGNRLREWLWSSNSGVILTSATLRALGSFNDFAVDSGLDTAQSAYFRCYESPFDYLSQAKLVVDADVPFEPSNPLYADWLRDHLYCYLSGQISSLVLFTNRSLMHRVRDHLMSQLTADHVLLQCQGDRPRSEIIANHSKAIASGVHSVIFGLSSFAEGIDLPGKLLENLIITKLPFEVPDTPIVSALMEYEELRGNNPFMTVTLPRACTALEQSVGRLVRSETDTGRCIILDKRLVTKQYGWRLIESLPPFKRVRLCELTN